ncbi:MAG: Mth938-like domain-containing protein [Gammaproteobacteria bacterium]|nr:Mth938-like domain-containing protein [Gammaproteobacteria bacterium]
MLLNQTQFTDQLPVQAYESGRLKMNNQFFEHSVILKYGQMPTEWVVSTMQTLSLSDLQPLLDEKPQVILLGTGEKLTFPSRELMKTISDSGFAIEIMDTGAASRTYNLLLAEGRRVIAGLIV